MTPNLPTLNVAGKTFNVANGKTISLNQMLELLNRLLDTDVQPRFEDPRVGDVRDSLADISGARKYLGYEPTVGFEEGMKQSIEFYKSLLVSK